MRQAGLLIVIVTGILSPGLPAQVGMSRDVASSAQSGEADRLRSELASTQRAKNEAAQDKARAYRQAHILYRDCAKELRAFRMLSAQALMRDADFLYKYRQSREFSNVAGLEQAVADLENKAKSVAPVK